MDGGEFASYGPALDVGQSQQRKFWTLPGDVILGLGRSGLDELPKHRRLWLSREGQFYPSNLLNLQMYYVVIPQ